MCVCVCVCERACMHAYVRECEQCVCVHVFVCVEKVSTYRSRARAMPNFIWFERVGSITAYVIIIGVHYVQNLAVTIVDWSHKQAKKLDAIEIRIATQTLQGNDVIQNVCQNGRHHG